MYSVIRLSIQCKRIENKIKERIFVEFDNYGLKYADRSVRNKLFFFSNDHAERVFHKLLVIWNAKKCKVTLPKVYSFA